MREKHSFFTTHGYILIPTPVFFFSILLFFLPNELEMGRPSKTWQKIAGRHVDMEEWDRTGEVHLWSSISGRISCLNPVYSWAFHGCTLSLSPESTHARLFCFLVLWGPGRHNRSADHTMMERRSPGGRESQYHLNESWVNIDKRYNFTLNTLLGKPTISVTLWVGNIKFLSLPKHLHWHHLADAFIQFVLHSAPLYI